MIKYTGKKFLQILTTTLVFSTGVVVNGNNLSVNNLPAKDKVDEAVNLFGAEDSYISFLGDKIVRAEVFDNEPIQVYYNNLTETNVEALTVTVDKYNELFEVINPTYKFELNHELEYFNMLKQNTIFVTNTSNNLLSRGFFNINELFKGEKFSGLNFGLGLKPSLVNDGIRYSHTNIIINNMAETLQESGDEKTLERQIELMEHEFMHSLGIGDLYLQENDSRNTDSIMGGFLANGFQYSQGPTQNDIKLLIALYGDITKEENVDKYWQLINSTPSYEKYLEEKKQYETEIDKQIESNLMLNSTFINSYLEAQGQEIEDNAVFNFRANSIVYYYESLDGKELYKMNGLWGEKSKVEANDVVVEKFLYEKENLKIKFDDGTYFGTFGKYVIKIDTAQTGVQAIEAYRELSKEQFDEKFAALQKQSEALKTQNDEAELTF